MHDTASNKPDTLFRKKEFIEYIGVRDAEINFDDGGGCGNPVVHTKKTTYLTSCISDLKKLRDTDLKNQMESPEYDSIRYTICVYLYEELGWTSLHTVCSDSYNEDDDDNVIVTTEKDPLFDADANEQKNISKKVQNSTQSDKKKLDWNGTGKLDHIGNITPESILNLLREQHYKCYKCGDEVLTYSYIPFCSYQFSIDRLDNTLPHNVDNVRISCYFCNCKDHVLFGKSSKFKCSDTSCHCHKINEIPWSESA